MVKLFYQTEAKEFYCIRSQRACQLVSDMLGERSIVGQGTISASILQSVSRSLSEGSRRLMTQTVRRTDDAIIFNADASIRGERIGYHQG
ncbi:MAG: hypothetical protein R2748_35670 [Bryobacterales bacterium]